MGRTKGTKNKNKTVSKVVNTAKNKNVININLNSKTKPKSKRRTKTIKSQPEINNNPLSRGASQNLGFHPRGLINNELQQPTIIQQIQPPPDSRFEKLEKRTKKIKEYLKGKGDTKEKAININSPAFQDVFETPKSNNSRLVSEETMEGTKKKLNFEEQPKKKGFFNFNLFTSSKTKPNVKKEDIFSDTIEPPKKQLLLEYKPPKPPSTAPAFMEVQSSTTETQTTPEPTGITIKAELKNLVNYLHSKSPNKKLKYGPFKSDISKKLRDLGVGSSHTDSYVKEMWAFYDMIYNASNNVTEVSV